jgi:hypothetical protein
MGANRSRGWFVGALAVISGLSCNSARDEIILPALDIAVVDAGRARFGCVRIDDVACQDNVHMSCIDVGEFLETKEVDCTKQGLVCDEDRVCVTCTAGDQRCKPCDTNDLACDHNIVQKCDARGEHWDDVETCDLAGGDACADGACENMCKLAELSRSYVGCEFYAADLDNVALDDMNNASAQQFAVAVTNPHSVPIRVKVQINNAAVG